MLERDSWMITSSPMVPAELDLCYPRKKMLISMLPGWRNVGPGDGGEEMWAEDSSTPSPLKLDLKPALPPILIKLSLFLGGYPSLSLHT